MRFTFTQSVSPKPFRNTTLVTTSKGYHSNSFTWPFPLLFSPLTTHNGEVLLDLTIVQNPYAHCAKFTWSFYKSTMPSIQWKPLCIGMCQIQAILPISLPFQKFRLTRPGAHVNLSQASHHAQWLVLGKLHNRVCSLRASPPVLSMWLQTAKFIVKNSKCVGLAQEIGFYAPNSCS
jgi:hypothetical protein